MNKAWRGDVSRRRFLAATAAIGLAPTLAFAQDTNPDLQVLPAAAAQGDVYLLRGFADVFSRGLDEMGAELNGLGVSAHVQGHLTWRSVARRIIADTRRNGRVPVVLVGHSLGANAVISIAERLAEEGIAVDYMATFAATAPDPVPANVRRVVNYYFATNGWGEPLVPARGFSGTLRNRDFSASATIGHFNIEKQRPLQAEVLRDVLRTLGR